MWDYSEKVKDHFFNPRNVGEIENPDAVGEVGSLACGDALKLMLKLDKSGRITDVKFKTFGCGSAIASASALTEMLKGKTLDDAAKITDNDIAEYLDGLPEQKMHCSVMGREALEAAIANYRGLKLEKPFEEGTIVCKCFGVTDNKISHEVREHKLTTVEQVTNYCKAGGGCRSCHPQIQAIINEVWQKEKEKEMLAQARASGKKMTNIQKMKLIEDIIEKDIRPTLQADGGDIELIDIEGDLIKVSFRGSCVECPSSKVTLKSTVEARLREFVTNSLIVEEVTS
ncbi:MAG: Fe-S cluster assembly protein NifU [Candidatus Loosdrechtia sp.]|uniref:Fe-S cluster assembly protein NifU n=1 Tax=Candidatus Loosdrechtia sp. TaxID=3101272 RepID=UPI003A63265D|nr:MAG: Fe-S cluster assembly protein NifU [Candidatus Jettenia sp. AMX2]